MRTVHALVSCLIVLIAALAVGGCAVPATSSDHNAEGQLRTASDQTDADRRARVRLELASGYFARGQSETALDQVKLALAADPGLAEAYNLRGLIYASMMENRLAEESFQRALTLNPRDADTLHNYGWYLCEQRRFDEALQQFDKALAQPQYRDAPRSLLTQGVCLARAGRMPEAEKALARAYEFDPASPVTAVNLSEVLYRRGDYERARFYVRRVNLRPEQVTAQSLWLAARIEHKLGNRSATEGIGQQLRTQFPQAPETLAYVNGSFDE